MVLLQRGRQQHGGLQVAGAPFLDQHPQPRGARRLVHAELFDPHRVVDRDPRLVGNRPRHHPGHAVLLPNQGAADPLHPQTEQRQQRVVAGIALQRHLHGRERTPLQAHQPAQPVTVPFHDQLDEGRSMVAQEVPLHADDVLHHVVCHAYQPVTRGQPGACFAGEPGST